MSFDRPENQPSTGEEFFNNGSRPVANSLSPVKQPDFDPEGRKKFFKVLYMGFGFFLLFTAFMSASNLVAEIYQQLHYDSLGIIGNLVLYAVFLGSLFVMPGVIKDWQYKRGVFIGSLGYFFTLIAGVMTTSCSIDSNKDKFWCTAGCIYPVNIIFAAINGLTAPILWVSANKYVTGCTNESNKGTYLGIFASFVAGAQLLGSILSAFVIKNFGQFDFYLIATCFVILAIILFFFAPPVERFNEEVAIESIMDKATKMVRLAMNPRMRPFLPYIAYVGLLLAVYTSFEFQIIDNAIPTAPDGEDLSIYQDYITALVLIAQGVAGLAASYSSGRFADLAPMRIVLSTFNVLTLVGIIMGYISFKNASLGLCYVLGVFLGMGYSGSLALTNIVMAKDFDGTTEAFALSQTMNTFGTIIGLILSIFLKKYVIVFLSIMLGLLVLNQLSLCFYRPRPSKSLLQQTDEV